MAERSKLLIRNSSSGYYRVPLIAKDLKYSKQLSEERIIKHNIVIGMKRDVREIFDLY
jgi:hypothetical protein